MTIPTALRIIKLIQLIKINIQFFQYHCCNKFSDQAYYSYKTARTCSEPRTEECRLSFAVEVMTASRNWKHPLPLKIILVPVSNGYYVLEMVDT